jgi:hypothetical protein
MQQSKIFDFNLSLDNLFCRQRLIEIHDEYEEREQRWNRIATILNRDDLLNFGSSTPVTYRGKDSPRLRS